MEGASEEIEKRVFERVMVLETGRLYIIFNRGIGQWRDMSIFQENRGHFLFIDPIKMEGKVVMLVGLYYNPENFPAQRVLIKFLCSSEIYYGYCPFVKYYDCFKLLE